MSDNPLPDMATLREEMVENTRLLATPIDFIDLVERGILGPGKRGWYELLRADQLPKHARLQVISLKSEKRGDHSRSFLKFGKTHASAAKLYQRLTGETLKAV